MKCDSDRMHCKEITGGNLATSKAYRVSGLDIFVESSPFLDSRSGGGDIYYVTACESPKSGRVTRLMLADIAGHGSRVANLADSLKSTLEKNVERISQSSFVQRVNREYTQSAPEDRMATAVVATYFESQKRLSLGMAGHPNPFLYRKSANQWYKIDEHLVNSGSQLANLPFGVCEDSAFPTRNIEVQQGDMFLLYSDAFTEALDRKGTCLGVDGLLNALNRLTELDVHEIIPRLRSEIRLFNESNLLDDDATLILGKFKPPANDPLTDQGIKVAAVRETCNCNVQESVCV